MKLVGALVLSLGLLFSILPPGVQARAPMRDLEFDISGAVMRFSVPARPSSQVPRLPPVEKYDLGALALDSNVWGEDLFKDLWEIRSPILGRVRALLKIRLAVLARRDATADLRCPNALWEHERETAARWAEEHKGSVGLAELPPVPTRHEIIERGGVKWVRYRHGDTEMLKTGVTPTIVLMLAFRVTSNGERTHYQEARNEADAITESVVATISTAGIPLGGQAHCREED
jgi:hypothetical protein